MPVVSTQKLTVSLPRPLVERLRALVPPRKRSALIAEALEERLAREEQLEAIENTAGAWKDKHHPDMKTDEDVDRWLEGLRGTWGDSEPRNG